jgi:hypothetical protein
MTACHVVDDEGGASPGGGEVHENTVYAFYREGCLCAHTSLPVRCVVYTPCVPYREGCLYIQYTPFPVRHTLRIYTVRILQGGMPVPFRGGTGYSYIVSHRGVYYTVRGVGIVNCILYTPPCVTDTRRVYVWCALRGGMPVSIYLGGTADRRDRRGDQGDTGGAMSAGEPPRPSL